MVEIDTESSHFKVIKYNINEAEKQIVFFV